MKDKCFNPFLVCGPKPKKFTEKQKKRLHEELAKKKGKITDAHCIDMEYILRGKKK